MHPRRRSHRLPTPRRHEHENPAPRTTPRDAGQATTEYVMWAALLVVVVVALVAGIQAIGVDVLGNIRDAIG